MTLKESRILFTSLLARQIRFLEEKGYRPAFGEGMDRRTSKDPTTDHMRGSLHELGLAQDIDLYGSVGEYLEKTEDHLDSGLHWESLHPYCRWGGNWDKDLIPFEPGEFDGNHYSFAPPELVGNRA